MTPEQKRKNRVVGFVLVALVLAIFLWTIFGHVLSAA